VHRFALYDDDTYLRTSTEVFGQIAGVVARPGAETRVLIVGCMAEDVFGGVSHLVEELFATGADVFVEHLLTVSATDYAAEARTFTRLIPLLHFKRYMVLQGESSGTVLSGNTIIVRSHLASESTTYVLTFLPDLSTCLVSTSKAVGDFFELNYESVKSGYREALLGEGFTDVLAVNDAMAELMEDGSATYLIKPNFCFDQPPLSAYENMLAQLTPEQTAAIRLQLAGAGGAPDISVEQALGTLERRILAARRHQRIDVFSVNGLREFAATGRITDHFDWLPSFTPEDRAATIRYVQGRYNDPGDDYILYITREDFLPDGELMTIIPHTGIIIEHTPDRYRSGDLVNMFIANVVLTTAFADYIRNHIPAEHAMSREDTNAFLDELLAELDGLARPVGHGAGLQ
jgi:hypothetical protein